MTNLAETLDLLQRHHRHNGTAGRYGAAPSSAHWGSLWGRLGALSDAAPTDPEVAEWLRMHGDIIRAVEACREGVRKPLPKWGM